MCVFLLSVQNERKFWGEKKSYYSRTCGERYWDRAEEREDTERDERKRDGGGEREIERESCISS